MTCMISPKKVLIRISLGLLFLVCASLPALGDEDCGKAQDLYDHAKNLLNYHERRDLFRKALDLCPSYAEAHVNLADAHENLEEYDPAETHYHQAIRLKPDFAIPYIGLGEVYLKTGRYGLAKDAFQKGLSIDSRDETLQEDLRVVDERLSRENQFYPSKEIRSCLVTDKSFRLMCMCPTDHYSFLKKWVCIPPIFFGTGSSKLLAKQKRQLTQIGLALKSKTLKDKQWIIIGHADNIGPPDENQGLSENRAHAVKRFLVKKLGLNSDDLTTSFFGQNRPRSTNTTLEGRAENRRVEIVLKD